ncbi:MAG: DUF424 family protein [Candidatus Altiarchaeales archaeon]|nr:DUF424 family protein [Candidatus Altiarchaeales archaeon]MBD3415984.1 DUF424 family protein [Candidatus Altiarchaeales archaeon]
MRSLRRMVADAQDKIDDSMYSAKVHRLGSDTLLAACDQDILGERYTDGELEIHVNERFYGGEEVTEEQFMELVREASIANLMGDGIVEVAVRRKLIDEENTVKVCGVKHAQIISLL